MLKFIFVLSIFCAPVAAFAFGEGSAKQAAPPLENPITATMRLQPSKVEPGGTAEIIIKMNIAESYHAYLDRFKLHIDSPDDLKLADFKLSPVVKFKDVVSKAMKDGVKSESTMTALIEVPTGFHAGAQTLKVSMGYQACTDDFCLFPKTLKLETPFSVGTKASFSTAPAVAAPMLQRKDSFQAALGESLWSAFALVFVVGFLTSLTPCVYPMIPITLAVLGARSKEQSAAKGFSLAFVYVLGIAVTYASLGLVAAYTGALFGAALSNVYVVSAIALIFVAMAASMFGFFEIQAPAFVRNRLGAARTSTGYVGAFGTGLVAGVVASPCVGPVLVSVLAYIAQTKSMGLGFSLLFVFALGLGVPFLALGMSSSLIHRIPKAGPWMETVKIVFGAVMLAMAVYYIWPLFAFGVSVIAIGLSILFVVMAIAKIEQGSPGQSKTRKYAIGHGFILACITVGIGALDLGGIYTVRSGPSASSDSFAKLPWKGYSTSLVNEAKATGKPILIDFTAEWCGACHELERKTFTDARVRELSEKFTLLRVDATTDTPEIKEILSRYQVRGLPTLVFYNSKGQVRDDLVVTGFETPDVFHGKMLKVD